MKRFLSCMMALLMVLTLVACTAPAGTDGATEASTEAEVALSISGLSYSKSGTIADFQIQGTINASEALDRIEYNTTMVSNALGTSVSDDPGTYQFEENVTTVEMSELTDYFIAQYTTLYDIYAVAVGLVGADDSLMATMDCTCYDVAGNTVNFTISYKIVSEETDADISTEGDPLSIKDLAYPTSGTIADFIISGTISSPDALEKIVVSGKMESDARGISVSDGPDTYVFNDGVTIIDLSELTSFFTEMYGDLYDVYVGLAELVGADDSLVATLNCTCYDVAGNSVNFTIAYEIVSE